MNVPPSKASSDKVIINHLDLKPPTNNMTIVIIK